MSQKIKILDPHEAIKIAAGEVIERPANIVKELIENSIDAGAKNIILHLTRAGKDLIKITDDGSGMSPDDAKLCFAHHATSKISSVLDLNSIMTYGFRGEALSSIASVSHVALTTKLATDKLATCISIQNSKFIAETNTSHATGTTIVISKLFDNIPARKKFLKTDETEWNLIVTIIQAFALRCIDINFKVFHNDFMIYNCPATTEIKVRSAQIFNNQSLHDQLLNITTTTNNSVTVSGAISNIHYYRFNRGQIFTFVNNRWVKNAELFKGILKGYDGTLPAQKFPAAFVFIDIDPTEVDINIHPKKEEIKFLNPNIVQRAIEAAVKDCLKIDLKKTELDPRLREDEESGNFKLNFQSVNAAKKNHITVLENLNKSQNPSSTIISDSPHPSAVANAMADMREFYGASPAKLKAKTVDPSSLQNLFQSSNVIPGFERGSQSFKNSLPPAPEINTQIYIEPTYNIAGQFKKTYIMLEKEDQLIMIDQHAAHERILYQRFKENIAAAQSVQLLFPHVVKLSEPEIILLEKYEEILKKHAIIFEPFSDTEIIIRSTPIQMSAQAAQEIIKTVLQWLEQHQDLESQELFLQLHEQILASKACKAAFKAGDTLNLQQMQNLLKELQKTENNFCCPHGRPIAWGLTLKEIEKHFKRDYTGAKPLFNVF
jgi:DNA mismatch repair protein MutL